MRDTTTLDDKLARLTITEIDAMTDEEVAAVMGATPEDLARTPASHWSWRASAKAATDEYAEKVIAESRPVPPERAAQLRQLARGGRPPLGQGESVQVRARLPRDLAALLDAAVARTGRSRSEIMRDALEEHLGRWAAEVSAQEGKAVVVDLMAALDASLAHAKAAAAERASGQPARPKRVSG